MADCRNGTGATFVIATNAYDVEILSINQGEQSRPVLDCTHMGSTEREKAPGGLVDYGSMDVEAHLDPNELDAMKTALTAAASTGTLTFNTAGAETVGANCTGTGFVSSHNYTIPLEDKMTVGFTWTWAGACTWADAT